MRSSVLSLLLALFFSFLVAHSATANVEIRTFNTPEADRIYHELIFELRCLVCQNNNLEDSNAELAVDLRRQTYEMVQEGASKQDVVDYMVARYGEFVLYRPPFTATTLLLWVGPFVFLVGGMFIMMRMIKNKKQEPSVEMNAEEQEKVRALLDDK